MKNSIEEILSTLLLNASAEKDEDDSKPENNEIQQLNEHSKKIQRKIDLLKSFEPAVSDKNKEYINFFIKALTIAKLISDMESKK